MPSYIDVNDGQENQSRMKIGQNLLNSTKFADAYERR